MGGTDFLCQLGQYHLPGLPHVQMVQNLGAESTRSTSAVGCSDTVLQVTAGLADCRRSMLYSDSCSENAVFAVSRHVLLPVSTAGYLAVLKEVGESTKDEDLEVVHAEGVYYLTTQHPVPALFRPR